VPVQATEQYPKGLGANRRGPSPGACPERPTKLAFQFLFGFRRSCIVFVDLPPENSRCGNPRPHVCATNRAGLLARRFSRLQSPDDGVASRMPLIHEQALRRLEMPGAKLSLRANRLFEWIGGPHSGFKEIRRLVQERMKRGIQKWMKSPSIRQLRVGLGLILSFCLDKKMKSPLILAASELS